MAGVDLRNLSEVESKLKECDIENDIPTVFLAECVLVYMALNKSSQLLQTIANKFKSALFINYEMVSFLIVFILLLILFVFFINLLDIIVFMGLIIYLPWWCTGQWGQLLCKKSHNHSLIWQLPWLMIIFEHPKDLRHSSCVSILSAIVSMVTKFT